MRRTGQAFGFYPEALRADTGAVGIRPLPELEKVVREVLSSTQVDDGWIYVPTQQALEFMSGQIHERPFSARVFALPRTPALEFAQAQETTTSYFTSGHCRSSSACG